MAKIFMRGPMQGDFLGNSKANKYGNVIAETPNGTRHSNSMHGMFETGSGVQEHQGALNPPSKLGNRGGSPGKKPTGQ